MESGKSIQFVNKLWLISNVSAKESDFWFMSEVNEGTKQLFSLSESLSVFERIL